MLDKAEKKFVKESFERIELLYQEMDKVIIGQYELKESLLVALLGDGHILIEGEPGLAKTLAAKVFAQCIGVPFDRISLTTDVSPKDFVVGATYRKKGKIIQPIPCEGPILRATIFLADELNRTPPKTQSALLEAMEEKQITFEVKVYKLGTLGIFLVIAVQNPIEREATYPLAEALMERFLIKLFIPFPNYKEERIIAARSEEWKRGKIKIKSIFKPNEIVELRDLIYEKHYPELMDPDSLIIRYITRVVREFRKSRKDKEGNGLLEYGISPRGTEDLKIVSRAYAFLAGADMVLPKYVKRAAFPALRGKFNLTNQAKQLEGKTENSFIKEILDKVPVEEVE